MKYTTKITDIKDGKEAIRGYDLSELAQKKSFVETIFLLLKGDLPDENETKMMNVLFTSAIDHSPGTASANTARIVASAKNSLHVGVSAGILAMGERHGSAIEGSAKFFQENKDEKDIADLVMKLKEQKVRVPGYGHPTLSKDHRSDTIFSVAKDTGIYGKHCTFAESFHKELNNASSKELPINIDGAMAAVLSDMGFDWGIMKGFFIIARVPGLVAQTYEELTNDKGIRRVAQEEIEYTGETDRKL